MHRASSRRARRGALVEEKTASLAWHYRARRAGARARSGPRAALRPRRAGSRSRTLEVLAGNKVLEVRLAGGAQGHRRARSLARAPAGAVIVAIGDDRTDEDMFAALPPGGVADSRRRRGLLGTLPSRLSDGGASPPRGSYVSAGDPLWYKDAIIYQLHVKTFCDSNGDGIGDFRGPDRASSITCAISASTASGCCRSYPSPFRDDGYDIADYCSIHPEYGTLDDFTRRSSPPRTSAGCGSSPSSCSTTPRTSTPGSRRRAARATHPRRDWYVWSDTDDKYSGVRIIFIDTETSNWAWDPVSKQYYWHRFFSHQPDLELRQPGRARRDVARHGVLARPGRRRIPRGRRAVSRSSARARPARACRRRTTFSSSCARGVDEHFTGKVLLAEANQWPEDVRAVLRRRRRVPHGVPLSADAAHVHGAFGWRTASRIVEIVERTPHCPRPASGRSFCATTTS